MLIDLNQRYFYLKQCPQYLPRPRHRLCVPALLALGLGFLLQLQCLLPSCKRPLAASRALQRVSRLLDRGWDVLFPLFGRVPLINIYTQVCLTFILWQPDCSTFTFLIFVRFCDFLRCTLFTDLSAILLCT